MGVIKYAFDTNGVGEMSHTFQPAISNVLSAHVRSENNQVLMDVKVEGVFNGDDLTAFDDFFFDWAAAFGFEFGVPVLQARNCGHQLPTKDGIGPVVINLTVGTFTLPRNPVTPSDEGLNHVHTISLELTDVLSMYLRQFAFANSESDAISRFSFLYNLLLQMSDDGGQPEVDSQILNIAPDCEQTISPKSGKYETIYTRLRNELGHKREGVNYSQTKSEIRSKVVEFSEIVKKCIISKMHEDS
ncbi:MAG: hypothetical protein WA635_05760 [Gallionella sp.]